MILILEDDYTRFFAECKEGLSECRHRTYHSSRKRQAECAKADALLYEGDVGFNKIFSQMKLQLSISRASAKSDTLNLLEP